MVVYVANPLYDAVFKYLMEDDRIAKTILSALLKKKVIDVKIRRNEYANLTRRESISMFRIDFAATVVDEKQEPHLMLIELQKTWLPTETLRFRRYLALQYNNEENMLKKEQGRYAIPMVAIYLLGHCIGKITEPIIYVNHHAYDYNDKEVKDGIPDPFVESLQHDSIIVQIPLLHGKVNNRLEQVLALFDQTNATDNKKVIKVDDQQFEGDNEMEYIVRRLQSAAADPEMRYQMNVEDEYFKELESRDTLLMEKDQEIEKKEGLIKKKDGQLKEKDGQLKEKDGQLKEKDGQLKEKDGQLKEKDGQLKEKDGQLKEKDGQLKEKDGQLKEKDGQLKEKDGQLKEKDGQLKEKDGQLKAQEEMLRNMIQGMLGNGLSIESIAKMTGKNVDEITGHLQKRVD